MVLEKIRIDNFSMLGDNVKHSLKVKNRKSISVSSKDRKAIYTTIQDTKINVDNTKQLNTISLATGYRGIELGLSLAGVQCREIAYVEIEAFAAANLVAEMEEGAIHPAPIWTDIKTFDARPFCGLVDLITGGYPCQPFSNAGQRKGTEDPRHLWPYIERIIRAARTLRCFFENVEGHISLGLEEVTASLRNLGYKVEVGLFSSAETGASHTRKRIFIMAELANPGLQRQEVKQEQTTGFEQFGSELADTNGQGLQGDKFRNRIEKKRWENQNRPTPQRCPIARPGEHQYPWEEPRQNTKKELKSRLGMPADGYDYRTDFLRALGNGVDPFTAAKAWTELDKLF